MSTTGAVPRAARRIELTRTQRVPGPRLRLRRRSRRVASAAPSVIAPAPTLAKYPGNCTMCGEQYPVGAPITKAASGQWGHQQCGPQERHSPEPSGMPIGLPTIYSAELAESADKPAERTLRIVQQHELCQVCNRIQVDCLTATMNRDHEFKPHPRLTTLTPPR